VIVLVLLGGVLSVLILSAMRAKRYGGIAGSVVGRRPVSTSEWIELPTVALARRKMRVHGYSDGADEALAIEVRASAPMSFAVWCLQLDRAAVDALMRELQAATERRA
jgi:hypothetical protein